MSRKITRLYLREAGYVGSTAVEAVPPVEVRSTDRVHEWSMDELPGGDVLVSWKTFVRPDKSGAPMKKVVCRSRIPAANIRSVGYEDEDVVEPALKATAK